MKKATLVSLLISVAGGAVAEEPAGHEHRCSDGGTEFVRLRPPRPGEWRYVFREPVQTFEEYEGRLCASVPGRFRKIALVRLEGEGRAAGHMDLELLEEFLEAYFMVEVELLPEIRLPGSVRRRSSRGFGTQVLADDVLRVMGEYVPRTADEVARGGRRTTAGRAELFPQRPQVARLGIVSTDLYGSSPGGGYLNFVFGMGAYGRGVAVISPARYELRYEGGPAGITPRKRVFKVAAHELGHVFGLAHCQTYECCMNGSNSLPESDRRPVHLCPECLRKLQCHLCFDRGERYRALAKVHRRLDWEDEAELAARRAALEPLPVVPGQSAEDTRSGEGTRK